MCTVFSRSELTGDTDIDDVTEDLNHPLFLSFTPRVVEVAANKNSREQSLPRHTTKIIQYFKIHILIGVL